MSAWITAVSAISVAAAGTTVPTTAEWAAGTTASTATASSALVSVLYAR